MDKCDVFSKERNCFKCAVCEEVTVQERQPPDMITRKSFPDVSDGTRDKAIRRFIILNSLTNVSYNNT
jgi:hypothetical protein